MSTLSNKNKKFYIIVVCTLVIMFGFGFLPPVGQITPDGMRVLGLFIGCIFAWCFGELVWSSIIGIASLAIFNFGTMDSNWIASFGNQAAVVMIVALVFCHAIKQCGLLSEIAKWIIGMKWAQKGPWLLVFVYQLAAIVIGAMATNIAVPMILLWALFYEMAKELDLKPHEPLSVIILCSIGIAGAIGVAVMPYGSIPILVKGTAETFDPQFSFNTGHYILLNLLFAIVYLFVSVLILKLLFGKKVKINILQKESYKMHLNTESKISLAMLVLIVLALIVPNLLSEGNILRELFLNKLSITGIFMFASAILMIIRVNGKPILDIVEGIRNVPWSLMLLVCAALGISSNLTADNTGIIATIVNNIEPLMADKSPLVLTLIFVAIALVMTNFINDAITVIILYPIAAQFITGAGGSEMLLAILFSQAAIQGVLMPSGSIAGAMLHGNSQWMKSKEIFFYVSIMEVIVLCVLLIISLVGANFNL